MTINPVDRQTIERARAILAETERTAYDKVTTTELVVVIGDLQGAICGLLGIADTALGNERQQPRLGASTSAQSPSS